MKFKGEKAGIAKELHDYLREKICKGDYATTNKEHYTWTVIVDDCFIFELWVCNADYGFKTYKGSFMKINFRESDKKIGWNKIKKQIEIHEETVLKVERKKQFDKLKSEFTNA
tara:strand:- start:3694 stop:4032 length:339 start_codon:yes stop_codon:yes gene_type:complete